MHKPWDQDPTPDGVAVESYRYAGEIARVPAESVRDCPIAFPGREALERLDPCFYAEKTGFDETHSVRGTIAMYNRLILIDPANEDSSSETLWRKYHGMSDDWLNHLGIAR